MMKKKRMTKRYRDHLRDREKRKKEMPEVISRLVFPGFGKRMRLQRKGLSQYIYQP